LKKVSISEGSTYSISEVQSFIDPSWDEDNTIVFGTFGQGIMQVSADAGTPETLIETEGVFFLGAPQILPDGKSVLFVRYQGNVAMIVIYSLESGETKELFEGDLYRYLPTGHLVYRLDGNLHAVPFDPDTGEVKEGEASMVDGVGMFSVSDEGTLVYIPGTPTSSTENTLVWVDREGKEEPLGAYPDNYEYVKISPDGKQVALTIGDDDGNEDIHIWDIARKNMTKLTHDEADDSYPLWTPDGEQILFVSTRNDGRGIYIKNAAGTGEVELLTDQGFPMSWADDGKILVLVTSTGDIGILSMEGNRSIEMLLQEEYTESVPMVSPNGRWMAYQSNESGQNEIFVRPFPDVDSDRQKVSTDFGFMPRWSPDGRELFYWAYDGLMVVSVESEPSFKPGIPEVLLQRWPFLSWSIGALGVSWDIHPNDNRFLMIKRLETTAEESAEASPSKFIFVLNWFEELKERVPVD
jgi:Tol biopolymer transport system component